MTKVEQQVECLSCQWNKNCVEPPTMTKLEVEGKMAEMQPKPGATQEDSGKALFRGLTSALIFGGRDTQAQVCPTFANALRSGPELSQQIKSIMKGS